VEVNRNKGTGFGNIPKVMQDQLLWEPCESKEELDEWLRTVLGVYLANTPLEEGNSSPMDFLWDCYSSALHGMKFSKTRYKKDGTEERVEKTLDLTDDPNYDQVGIAARGSQKSLTCGALEYLMLLHDPYRDLFHMASIRQQAKVTYRYLRSFIYKPYLKDTVNKTVASETEGVHDNILQLGTGTMDSVNSFHGSVIQDELDLTDRAVFKEASGMLSPTKDGRMALNMAISSRKFAFGNIQTLIDKKDEMGIRIHKWGILENTKHCPEERSGTKKVDIWVDVEGLSHISCEEHKELEEGDIKDRFEKFKGFEKCVDCPIFSFCQTRLKKQSKDNPYLVPVEMTIKYFQREDPEFFKAQRLNRKPSRKGLVYPQYTEGIHVCNYSRMWEILHGEPLMDANGKAVTVTKKMFVDKCRKLDLERNIAVDFGFNNGHMLLIFVDGKDHVYIVDEITTEQKSSAEMAKLADEAWGPLGIDEVYPDSADPGGMKEFEKLGYAVSHKVEKTNAATIAGFGTVRRFLKIPGTLDTNISVSYECVMFREQMALYHYKIDPKTDEPMDVVEKKNDHGPDAFRYFLHTRFGGSETTIIVDRGTPTRSDLKHLQTVPTPAEVAAYTGLPIADNRELMKKRIKKKNDDDDGNKGGGGFNFSFA